MPKALAVGGVPEHFNWPWQLALADGAFADAGAHVTWRDYKGGTGAMLAALDAGELDAALLLTEGALADAMNRERHVLVKVYVRSPLIWGIHVAAHSAIKRIRDMRGASYAISRYQSGSHLMAIVDALGRGWPLDALRFVTVGNLDGARQALAAGKADIFLWERFTTSPLVQAGEFRRLGDTTAPWPAFSVVVPKRRLAAVRQRLQRALNVVDRYATNLARRSSAVAEIAAAYDLDPRQTAAWFETVRWSRGYTRPASALRGCARVLHEAGIVAAPAPKLDTVWARL